MKKLLVLLAALLMLSGCAEQPAPVVEPETPPAPVQAEVPETPPAPEIPPEEAAPGPAEEVSGRPDLPLPVYCFGGTVVTADGSVLLEDPDHVFSPVYDAGTGKLVGIQSQPIQISMIVSDGFYDLTGRPILTGQPTVNFQVFGDLCWHGALGNYTLRRLSDGSILDDALSNIQPAGDYLVLEPSYWNAPCTLVDRTGETAVTLDRGFRLDAVLRDRGNVYLAMSSALDGRANLVNLKGEPLLADFCDEITAVTLDCAIVRRGNTWQAEDLATGEIRFRRSDPFVLLPDGALVETEAGILLTDLQGRTRYDTPLRRAYAYDWEGDGIAELILGEVLRDGVYTSVVLSPDGTELAALPTELAFLVPLSPDTLAYQLTTGEGFFHQQAHLLDLQSGSDTILAEGSLQELRQITTSGGKMLLCTTETSGALFLNDGTPARTDLGPCTYAGGDVFRCEGGLRCLDGTWLWQPEHTEE